VIVTGWTAARIPWPRCHRLEGRSYPWLLVDEELIRAIKHESAVALCYWWGVGDRLVSRWRKAFGVNKLNCEGTQRLVRDAAAQGGAKPGGIRS
jgi:hypothetical protein